VLLVVLCLFCVYSGIFWKSSLRVAHSKQGGMWQFRCISRVRTSWLYAVVIGEVEFVVELRLCTAARALGRVCNV